MIDSSFPTSGERGLCPPILSGSSIPAIKWHWQQSRRVHNAVPRSKQVPPAPIDQGVEIRECQTALKIWQSRVKADQESPGQFLPTEAKLSSAQSLVEPLPNSNLLFLVCTNMCLYFASHLCLDERPRTKSHTVFSVQEPSSWPSDKEGPWVMGFRCRTTQDDPGSPTGRLLSPGMILRPRQPQEASRRGQVLARQ